MDFRHLESFLAIAEELHFGRAAARLHLAQPSLSQQLQRLEREVGVQLVSRTSHQVRLTAAGRTFEGEARAILDATRRAVRLARDAASGRSETLRIGFNFPAGQRIVSPTLPRFGADHPNVSTTLWEARTGPQLTALADGRIDLALVFGGPLGVTLRSQRVLTMPLVGIVGRQHPWAGRREIRFRELADQPCMLVRRDESPGLHDAVLATADRCGVALRVIVEMDDIGTAGILLTTRPLVTFASATSGAHIPIRDLVAVPLVDPVPTVDVYALWRPDPQPVVGAFLSSLDAARPFAEPTAVQAVGPSVAAVG